MINLDKDNRVYNKHEETEADALADAVTKPTAHTDMTFGMGKDGYPAICAAQLSAKIPWLSAEPNFIVCPPRRNGCAARRGQARLTVSETTFPLVRPLLHMDNSKFQYQKWSENPIRLVHDMHGSLGMGARLVLLLMKRPPKSS